MQERPLFLSLLCIVSFVYYGLLILLFAGSLLFRDYFFDVIAKFTEASFPEVTYYLLVSIGLLLFTTSFIGTIRMWQLRRMGFYLYLLASILTMLLLFLFVSLSLWFLFSSIFMLFCFWLYAKRMQ
ncbi:MAG: hypothetical protein K9G58_04255 [Bacteroidales bacterium]|nr:hypothetical protein [Bacteroidales bacterium]MCF8387008.1 hypothetical protein [Bacteroidales bacterium]MCF8397357.1 hypothetical protein [Bacteroidales bacterium]